MAENSDTKKRKYFRKLPFICGCLTLYLSFMAIIPLSLLSSLMGSPISDLTLEIIQVDGYYYFLWGQIESGISQLSFDEISIANSVAFILWLCSVTAGIFGIIGSSYKAKPKNMKKMVELSLFLLIMILIYYISLFVSSYPSSVTVNFGPGFYILIILIVFFIISGLKITDYNELEN